MRREKTMCITCYQAYGSPRTRTEKTFHAVELLADPFFHDYYGNVLSVVVNDWDISDAKIEECKRKNSITPHQMKLANLLLSMSLSERSTALAVDQGLIDLPETETAAIDTDMENIKVELFVPLLVKGVLFQAGDEIEVGRDRARRLIQGGHAKPVPKVETYETQVMVNINEKKPQTRKRRTRKKTDAGND